MPEGRIKGLKPSKILIVKPSSLGDIVHSLPALGAIRRRFKHAEIHWVVAKNFKDLLEGHPMIDRLWVIDKDQWKKLTSAKSTVKEISNLVRGLRRQKYDLAIDLQGLLRSGMIMMASRAPVRVGFVESQEGSVFCYTHTVGGRQQVHAVQSYLKIAAHLGCDTTGVSFPMPISPFPMPFDEDYAVLVPGAMWKTKRWPVEKFAKLASKLPIKSVVVGGRGDMARGRAIAEGSGGKAVSLCGKTGLKELSHVMKGARLCVTNDSGPMHFAAAHGVPVVALFGPSSPDITAPYGKGHTVLKKEGLKCAPCHKKRCGDIKCMQGISVRRVLEAARAAL